MVTNQNTAETLKQALSDSYALYLKTQNYHWNVEGPHFKSLHELFEEHYTDLAMAIDEIAERIRALGEKAPGSFSYFKDKTSLKDGDASLEAIGMVNDLISSHEAVINTFKKVMNAADIDNDPVSEDLSIGRVNFHEKAIWMLKSIIK